MVPVSMTLLCLCLSSASIGLGDAKPVNNTSTTKTTTTTMVMYGRTAELTTAATHERTAELTIYGTEYVECKISTNQTSPTNVTWTRNGAKIKSDIVVADSQYQVIQKLELKGEVSEVGTYVCIMTDAIGSISSSSKQLKPSLIVTSAESNHATVAMNTDDDDTKSISIQCIVASFPKANVTFKRGAHTLVEEDGRVKMNTKTNGSRTIYELKIDPISSRDAGDYYCEARNRLLKSQAIPVKKLSVYVKCSNDTTSSQWKCPKSDRCVSQLMCETYEKCVKFNCEIPNLVKNAKIAHCSYDAAEIKWDKDEHSKSYSIEVAKADSMLRYYETVSNDITIRKLDNNTVYNFTIHARNNFGHGMDTTLSCKTARMVKPSKVKEMEFINTKAGFQVVWDASKDDGMDNRAAKALRYNVKYCRYNASNDTCKSIVTTNTSAALNEIDLNLEYTIEVTPINAAGQPGKTETVISFPPKYNSSPKQQGSKLLNILCLIILTIYILCDKEMV